MAKVKPPVIYRTKYSEDNVNELDKEIRETSKVKEQDAQYLVEYPTVYVINDQQKKEYTVYVGETNDIQRRTWEHLKNDPKKRNDWRELQSGAEMFVIGHEHFNKSLTLDIENRLMQYLSSVDAVKHLNNRRENYQSKYYTHDEMKPIFNKIWQRLNKEDPKLFPAQRLIEDSALFKASPFNKLTTEQVDARNIIFQAIQEALASGKRDQVILVKGEAGAGKTVLMSNIFFELAKNPDLSVKLMVNQSEQMGVYQQIAEKLGLQMTETEEKRLKQADPEKGKAEAWQQKKVVKTATFIKTVKPNEPIDLAFIDEAHLLLMQKNQSYTSDEANQLIDIIKRAKVTVAIYDEHQILQARQMMEAQDWEKLATYQPQTIQLTNQMRIVASKDTVDWLRTFIDQREILPIPIDDRYELRVFDDPKEMEAAIIEKNEQDQVNGLSRMVATYDWKYSSQSKPADGYWMVREGDWEMPWNYQLKPTKEQKHTAVKYKDLAWAEQPHTIEEIGSTYTVQGMDLNYVGVEIGPSVKYRNGKVIFDPSESANDKAVNQRTMKDGSKQSFGEQLLRNELNVLLTRGVHGLYFHAVDPELQATLKKAYEAKG